MNLLLNAFWRAAAYCFYPRVLLLSLLPLLAAGGAAALLGVFYWADAVAALRSALPTWPLFGAFGQWLDSIGAAALHEALAPMLLLALAIPMVVVLSLLLVAVLLTPALVALVARHRFPDLQRRHGAGFWHSAASSIGCTLLALLALLISVPLWLIPPLVVVLPPLIWGWLSYRVLGFDVLADHASADERRQILRTRRGPLLGIGIVTGVMGAAPSLIWAFGALTLVFAPLLLVVAVWLYTLVFIFSALWFAHYALAELATLRARPDAIRSASDGPNAHPDPGAPRQPGAPSAADLQIHRALRP